MSEKFTLFYGGPFSQWNRWLPFQFEIDGFKYVCAEQYMMEQKAVLFGDLEMRKKIMQSSNPKDQKAFGKLVKGFSKQKWDSVARDIVYRGNYAKFTQNEGLKNDLLSTAGTTLVEASPYDDIWGIKLAESNLDCLDRNKWRGTNWLGEVLTKVREDIIAGIETKSNFKWS